MPLYTFTNTETEETVDMILSISAREEFLKENPHMKPVIFAPSLIAGRDQSSGGKLPDAFKDRLRLMKEKNPKSTGVDHLI